ncbi:MAG: hypothetical protein HY711_01660 [Candidatus Melainabacteria bacterium]|nr:hypothetical protein [Candidatus Melainabacteria bacterium]
MLRSAKQNNHAGKRYPVTEIKLAVDEKNYEVQDVQKHIEEIASLNRLVLRMPTQSFSSKPLCCLDILKTVAS